MAVVTPGGPLAAVAGANVDLVSAQAELQQAIGHKVLSARIDPEETR